MQRIRGCFEEKVGDDITFDIICITRERLVLIDTYNMTFVIWLLFSNDASKLP